MKHFDKIDLLIVVAIMTGFIIGFAGINEYMDNPAFANLVHKILFSVLLFAGVIAIGVICLLLAIVIYKRFIYNQYK